MQIEGTKITHEQVRVNVRPIDLWRALRAKVLRRYDLQNAEHLRNHNGKMVFTADDEHRHGSITESVVVQDPSPEQVHVWQTLKQFEDVADLRNLDLPWPS